ncbi:hypothetical protein NRB20_07320 [Nocardia sp. RB20]|uniref:Uncharacterized protein n=1 Tax=Nocardia macrotermitis TaxID=2585198 RepID=A0A7K0CW64_9NOCA|nr:hypothetical protein [Nocardia macrotermitis]
MQAVSTWVCVAEVSTSRVSSIDYYARVLIDYHARVSPPSTRTVAKNRLPISVPFLL